MLIVTRRWCERNATVHGIVFVARKDKGLLFDTRGHLMSASTHCNGATACCAFCDKPLPIVNGELQPWRAASGQFFCDEFCADDAEEARFHNHRRANRRRNDLRVCAST
jgi:hypothetical protein